MYDIGVVVSNVSLYRLSQVPLSSLSRHSPQFNANPDRVYPTCRPRLALMGCSDAVHSPPLLATRLPNLLFLKKKETRDSFFLRELVNGAAVRPSCLANGH